MVKCLATFGGRSTRSARSAILSCAPERPAFPRGSRGDLGQVSFGGLQEALALAGPLGFQERVLAGDQPLAGVVRMGDLGQVRLAGQWTAAVPRRGPAP